MSALQVIESRSTGGDGGGGGRAPTLSIADVTVDTGRRTVTRAGQAVDLTARETDLLVHLLRHPERVHTRDGLLAEVWHSSASWQGTATVTEHVHRLRRKLGGTWLTSLRGVGYRVDGPVEEAR